jgi:hypothetical protein
MTRALSEDDQRQLDEMRVNQRELGILLATLIDYMKSVEARLRALEAAPPLPSGQAVCDVVLTR